VQAQPSLQLGKGISRQRKPDRKGMSAKARKQIPRSFRWHAAVETHPLTSPTHVPRHPQRSPRSPASPFAPRRARQECRSPRDAIHRHLPPATGRRTTPHPSRSASQSPPAPAPPYRAARDSVDPTSLPVHLPALDRALKKLNHLGRHIHPPRRINPWRKRNATS
jgi:hypothetical protein